MLGFKSLRWGRGVEERDFLRIQENSFLWDSRKRQNLALFLCHILSYPPKSLFLRQSWYTGRREFTKHPNLLLYLTPSQCL